MAEYKLLINGELVSSSSGKTVDDIGPASGEAIARVPESTLEDVERAVVAAREAFDDGRWSDLTHGARAAALEKLAMLMEAHAQEIAELESQDVGKPIKLARDGDIPFSIDNIHFFAGAARHLAGTAASEYSGGHTSIIRREPVGVVASLAPWNYPMMMAAWKIGPALAAGNTVVLKPSDTTPETTLLMAQIAAEFLPPGTVIVFDDADIEAAVEGIAVAGYFNAGQDCTAATRVLAAPRIHDDFVAALG